MCLAHAGRMGSGFRNLFPGLFLPLPAPWHLRHTCPPPLCLRGYGSMAGESRISPDARSIRGWDGDRHRDTEQHGLAVPSPLGSVRRKWLWANAVAMRTLKDERTKAAPGKFAW